jgi:hypothetical protein
MLEDISIKLSTACEIGTFTHIVEEGSIEEISFYISNIIFVEHCT